MNSKFIASRASKYINEDGDYVVSFIVKGVDKMGVNLAFEEQKAEKNKIETILEVDIKPYKSRRSIEQNAALWFLLTKLSEAINGSKDKTSVEETYCLMLEEANIASEFILAPKEVEDSLRRNFRAISFKGTRNVETKDGRTQEFNIYQCYIGSSKYNTKEMYQLIINTLQKLDDNGVRDSEVEAFRRKYEK